LPKAGECIDFAVLVDVIANSARELICAAPRCKSERALLA
jgi:hypothetical protein